MHSHASDGFAEGGRCAFAIALLNPQRADRVPRVCATLASVQMSIAFGRELALEGRKGLLVVAAGETDETSQPVKGDGAEPRRPRRLIELTRDPERQVTLGLGERVPRDVHCRNQPVRERKAWQQCQRAMRS